METVAKSVRHFKDHRGRTNSEALDDAITGFENVPADVAHDTCCVVRKIGYMWWYSYHRKVDPSLEASDSVLKDNSWG
jgi:hypothetical protein